MAEHRNKNHGFHRFHPEKRQGFGHFAMRRRLTAPMASQLLWAFAAAEVFHVPLLEALANHVVRRGGSGGGWGPQGMGGWGMGDGIFALVFGMARCDPFSFSHFLEGRRYGG